MKGRDVLFAVLICGLLAATTSCSSVAVNPWSGEEQGSASLISEVDSRVRDLIRKDNIPGLSIAVVQNGEILLLRGYGYADRESQEPATPDTVFRAYSIAKVFTALESVRLADEGHFALDDSVADLLPEWEEPLRWDESAPVTVRHLLAHRSGLPRNSNYHESIAVAQADALRLQLVSLADAWSAYPAGYRYKYSNAGSNVLGRLIEVSRDVPYAIHMRDVLPAYGMERSAFLLSFLPDDSVVATGYSHYRGRYTAHAPYDIIGLASGNLYTSSADLASFMMKVLGSAPGTTNLPISHETLAATFIPQFARPDDPERNGLGWMTSEESVGELMVWHQGGDYDSNALVALFPGSATGICILSNTGSYEGSRLLTLATEIFKMVPALQRQAAWTPPAAARVLQAAPEAQDLSPTDAAAPPLASSASNLPVDEQAALGRYVAYGETLELVESGGELRAEFGPATLRLSREGVGEMGVVYAVRHWLDTLNPGGVFPVDLSLLRLIIPLADASGPTHLWMVVSDVDYTHCPRYPEVTVVPTGWESIAGEYDHCTITVKDNTLQMSGVGYLVERSSRVFVVLGGPYAGETVIRDEGSGSVFHQGLEYRPK